MNDRSDSSYMGKARFPLPELTEWKRAPDNTARVDG